MRRFWSRFDDYGKPLTDEVERYLVDPVILVGTDFFIPHNGLIQGAAEPGLIAAVDQ